MSKLWKLIRLFQQSKGRSPSPSELANLKKQAEVVVEKEKIIRPDFGGSLREFTRKEDLYEGNKKGLEKLLESGEVKIGQALKTKKKKPAVDPKFESAVKAQDERRRDIKDWETRLKTKLEQQNKSNAYKSALRQYRDIDKKPLSIDEVTIRYKNLAKYPEGRNIIIDDITDIQKRHILPNIGNRSRDDLVNKLNKMVLSKKKQPNPFKKASDEVKGQLEMDFTDWDSKGMKGGGIAHMLGEEPRVGMMYGGDPGFAFEYGGSWADWRDNHQHMMPLMEYIGTKLPKERTPFRAGFKNGLEVLPEIQLSKITSSPVKEIDIDETDRTYGIKGSYQAPSWYTGGSLLKGKVKIDVSHDGNTIFKDTVSKEDAKDLYFGLGQKYGDKVELGTDTKGNWRINIKKSFKDGGVANMLGE